MNDIRLSPRLKVLAQFALSGERIVDVGTDHGHIPVWLALHGCAKLITATDIRRGPLENAIRTAAEYDVDKKIRFERCDGLNFCCAQDSDTVIIAGMGGDTIMHILSEAPWTKSGVRLLLQPQSKIIELCVWLDENCYSLHDAVLIEDAGRIYAALLLAGGAAVSSSIYAEDILLSKHDPLLPRWLNESIRSLYKALEGMSRANEKIDTNEVRNTLARLELIKGETEKWSR